MEDEVHTFQIQKDTQQGWDEYLTLSCTWEEVQAIADVIAENLGEFSFRVVKFVTVYEPNAAPFGW